MASLMDRLLQRSQQGGLSPQDLERLSKLAADERSRLSELLRQAQEKIDGLHAAGESLQAFEEQLAALTAEQERLQARIAEAGNLASQLTTLESRSQQIERLTQTTGERIQRIAEKGEAAQQASRSLEAMVELSRGAEQRVADIQARYQELAALDQKVGGIREWLDHFEGRTQSVVETYKDLTRTADGLRKDVGYFAETKDQISRDLDEAKQMAGSIEELISGAGVVKNLTRKNEEQLHKLNSLAEHVTQKTQVLATTQQALERAETQSRQANELVRGIEGRLQKVTEESRLIQSSDDKVESLTRLHHDLVERLQTTRTHHEEIEQESRALQAKISNAVNRLDEGLARSEMFREQVDLANERVQELAALLGRQQKQLDELMAREQEVVRGRKEADALLARLNEIQSLVATLEQRSVSLTALEEQLANVHEASAGVEERMKAVTDQRTLVEEVGSRLTQLGTIHDETRQRLASMAEGRQEVEQTLVLLGDFQKTRTEAQGRIQEISRRLDDVDQVHAHLLTLQKLARDLEGKTAELEPRLDFVQGVEGRLNRLDELSQAIDIRLDEQLRRHGELESMQLTQNGLKQELADLKSLAGSLQSSPQLGMMEGRMKDLERRFELTRRMLERTEGLEGRLAESETRTGSLLERAGSLEERMQRHEGRLEAIALESDRARTLRETWESEARALEQRQLQLGESSRSLAGELDQVKGFHAELQERWEGLREREELVARYEDKIRALESELGEIDRKISHVNSRQALVERIKRDVDGIYDTCEQSRRHAAEVIAGRSNVAEARRQMDDVGRQATELDGKMARLREKLGQVEEAEFKIDALSNILDDLTVNLETFREQKAIIDHVAAKLSQIDFEVKRAELVTQSLRDERELASRIHQGIESLRAAKTKAKKPPAPTLSFVRNAELPPPETKTQAAAGGDTEKPAARPAEDDEPTLIRTPSSGKF